MYLLIALCAFGLASAASIKTTARCDTYGPYGSGSLGTAFNDEAYKGLDIRCVEIFWGGYINGLRFYYGFDDDLVTGPFHGAARGERDMFCLSEGEYITDVSGYHGRGYMQQLRFRSNRGREFKYNEGGSNAFAMSDSWGLSFVSGRAGTAIHSLTFHFCDLYKH